MTSPYLESAVRRMTMWDAIKAGSAKPAPAYHATRDMPRCQWSGVHRFDLHAYEGEYTVEACMDCGKQRKYPTALNSAHCVAK